MRPTSPRLFGSRAQQAMLNFRARDLDAMLAQLRPKGADVAKQTQDMEGVDRLGWVTDPATLAFLARTDDSAAGRSIPRTAFSVGALIRRPAR